MHTASESPHEMFGLSLFAGEAKLVGIQNVNG